MKHFPKFIFGILIVVAIIFLLSSQDKKKSQAVLTSQENKFSLDFALNQTDEVNFKNFLENIGANSNVIKGIEFELDEFSTTTLSFATPIKADLKVQEKQVVFDGNLDTASIRQYNQEPFFLPDSTNLVISAPDLQYFITSNLNFPEIFSSWISDNSEPGAVIAFFDKTPQWALRAKAKDANLNSLKGLAQKLQVENSYKKEETEEVDFHLINLAEDEDKTLIIFKFQNSIFITPSRTSAEGIVNLQREKNSQITVFSGQEKESSFFILFKNTQKYEASTKLFELVLGDNSSLISSLKKIEELKFTLKANSFSGLINIK